MTIANHVQTFIDRLSCAVHGEQSFDALYQLCEALVGVRLFTVMCVDMHAMLANRAFSSETQHYPVSGTKPVEMNGWFEVVSTQRRTFVANTLSDIANVFPDHELIGSMGCGSVVNLPLVCRGELVATVNLLHEEYYFTSARVATVESELRLPGLTAWLLYQKLSSNRPR